MKVGCCVNMISGSMDGIGLEHVETLKKAGYDYVELPLAQIMAISDDEFNILKDKINFSGLKCEVCNNFFPPYIRLTGTEVNIESIYGYLDAALGRACELAVQVIVFGSSGSKNVPKGFPKAAAWEQLVSLLQYIDRQANKYGVTIAIEPLNRLESNIINTVEEGLLLIKQAGGNAIKLLVDYYHFVMERENHEILLEWGDALKHVHFACPNGRAYPSETDTDAGNYEEFFKTLGKAGYKGRVSVEAFSKNVANDASIALKLLRKLSV